MIFSLNNYLPHIKDNCPRLVVYPNNEVGAKLVSEYKANDIRVIQIAELLPKADETIPDPSEAIQTMVNYATKLKKLVLFVGIDSYLTMLRNNDKKDFFWGLRELLLRKISIHFLIGSQHFRSFPDLMKNPKFEKSLSFVFLEGEEQTYNCKIVLVPSEWVGSQVQAVEMLVPLLKQLGIYSPSGNYYCTTNETIPPSDCCSCSISPIADPNMALKELYNLEIDLCEEQASLLLCECKTNDMNPKELLEERFGGKEYLNCLNAPSQLVKLKDDKLWLAYIWMLKGAIQQNTYLFKVLQKQPTAENFLKLYIVDTALAVRNESEAEQFSKERASVVKSLKMVESLVANFVSKANDDIKSALFMNCDTNEESRSLIRMASKYELMINLPKVFDTVAPHLVCYLSPNYDYGNDQLTDYFTKLRCFRVRNSIDKEFVDLAYKAEIPSEIKKRDNIIASYDDGHTGLLVVDGLGAEYYPLLLNMAKRSNLKVAEKQIVYVNLPSITELNHIKWSENNKIPEVKQVDTISHDGFAKHEDCSYEANLAGIFKEFDKILILVAAGLKDHRRVLVTSDHGSSYLAVTAYNNGVTRTLNWENPDDWRYSFLKQEIQVSLEDLKPVYNAEKNGTYYVVKGYNRLPKAGGKRYGLHGGATLEERLVPFVVFTNDDVEQECCQPADQIIEDDDFELL